MKVGGPGRIQTGGVRGAGGKKAAGGFRVDQTDGAQGTRQAAGLSGVGSVDALIALQGTEDALTGKRRAVKRADNMLDVLEDIRMDLLMGQVPASKLRALLNTVNSQRHAVADPALQQVLDDVELRARVELAKYEHLM